ncbi:HAD-superfamily hydrolase, subfamily IIA [Beutenbergia cavernae DSM 12333]|uniref:HAD-superfamily hydrolase, subfamily IIA n=1 Tax=Beutenbergia cavernae (strain ATCC BAA-8 / DSM 12333 / CCUG 43141 / JCM 11478 / NBRC 16432 / NCIMB 13614 / HKI 0122) TaxID=471853 RepID=C5BW08_BEUC1|nr:HAD-IIA family hydrolase [Beutenbergia cavernae]ACQ80609.1 HAD-superfamily hydrolase, subfamily IIA [Beutenbergia cavernae DSM 12333]
MSSTLVGCARPPAEEFDAALLDLDGVVYRGPEPVEHAAEAIAAGRAAGMTAVFVTNNAARPPGVVADQLTSLGVPAEPSDVMTSSLAAAAMLREQVPAGSRVLAVGGQGLHEALAAHGLEVVTRAGDSPVAVVQGFGPDVCWRDLAEAAYAIAAGARYLATNLDATLPTERGMAPGNGSLVAALVHATGVRPASAGKPGPEIFRQAAGTVSSRRPLVIGDRLDTDLAGARAAGMVGLHVLTGVSGPHELLAAAPAERPHLLATDLRGILEPHPAPERGDDHAWRCSTGEVRVDGRGLVVRRADGEHRLDALDEVTLDELRAACAAAWDSADAGTPVDVASSTPLRVRDA